MNLWQQFLQNRLLLAALVSWATAQILKMIIYTVANHRLDWERLMGDGGMPSGHSATVSALAVSALIHYGLSSFQFAVTFIVAIVVMHDAMGVRLEAGKHARSINELFALLGKDVAPEEMLKEFLGHTPLQVVCGAVLGIVIALLLH